MILNDVFFQLVYLFYFSFVFEKLCYKFRKAIVSTSANISGEVAPKNFKEITDYIIDSVDYIVDFRRDDVSQPSASSVIKVDDGGVIKIIRE